jgi:hypothetical protein
LWTRTLQKDFNLVEAIQNAGKLNQINAVPKKLQKLTGLSISFAVYMVETEGFNYTWP